MKIDLPRPSRAGDNQLIIVWHVTNNDRSTLELNPIRRLAGASVQITWWQLTTENYPLFHYLPGHCWISCSAVDTIDLWTMSSKDVLGAIGALVNVSSLLHKAIFAAWQIWLTLLSAAFLRSLDHIRHRNGLQPGSYLFRPGPGKGAPVGILRVQRDIPGRRTVHYCLISSIPIGYRSL